MQKKIYRWIAIVLLVSALLTSISPMTQVSAYTYNVMQTRRVADIEEFPQSYQAGLSRVKAVYPNAQFIYYDTGLDWNRDVLTPNNELVYGRSVVPSNSHESWKSSNDEVEPGWSPASKLAIEYYMDPRNFLTEQQIFQFLNLTYDNYQTVKGVESILKGSFMDNKTIVDNQGNSISYAEAFYQIGKETGVSPYLLACRVLQEQGNGSAMITGTYDAVPGYYNYFNIGAYGSTTEVILTKGLTYAQEHDWDTPYKSIYGGAKVLAHNYVDNGTDTLYLQHWNVVANEGEVSYIPYMTNMLAPSAEVKKMYAACVDKNANYTFVIPVYNNMPNDPCDLPAGSENGSYLLQNLTLNNGELDIGTFSSQKYHYEAYCQSELPFVILKAKAQSATSSIVVNGTPIPLSNSAEFEKAIMIDPGFNEIAITVTAENGFCRDYTLRILNDDGKAHYAGTNARIEDEQIIVRQGQAVSQLKDDIQTMNCMILVTDSSGKVKPNDAICMSGDILMVKNQENQLVYKTPIRVNGDVNQDGYVTELDIDLVKAHILETTTLTVAQSKLADMDHDGNITVQDLGIIKVLTGDQLNDFNSTVTICADVQTEVYGEKPIAVDIVASDGTYYAEGYLIYNEGQIELENAENSGRIHFIADGSTVLFDNELNTLSFLPLVNSGTLDFQIEIKQAYDYIMRKAINVNSESQERYIKNTDLDAVIQFVQSNPENNDDSNHMILTMTNKTSKSFGNITVIFGEHLIGCQNEQEQDIVGLRPGESETVAIYTADDLAGGHYDSEIKIIYQNADAVEKLMTIPITFDMSSHEHDSEWKVTDTQHYMDCDVCNESLAYNHVYFKEDNNTYVCLECGHKKTFTITLNRPEAIMYQNTIFEPNVMLNGTTIDLGEYNVSWYVNQVKTSNRTVLSTKFNSVGYKTIDCVITNNEGLIITQSVDIYVSQPKTSANKAITVNSVTCDTISMKKYVGFEYKLNDGEWQNGATFGSLTSGQEYTISQRQKGTQNITSVRVSVGHHPKQDATPASVCGQNVARELQCAFCQKLITKTIPETLHEHMYFDYHLQSNATCQTGSIEIAECVYGCGLTHTRTLDDIQSHSFAEYVLDANSTCTSGRTYTASCDYGCGTTDIAVPNGETSGHQYVYTRNNDATTESSMTETGVCKYCDKTNTRTVDGTRLEYIETIDIEIATATTGQSGLPAVVTSTDGISVTNTTWTDSNGESLVGDASNIVVQSNETYRLAKLTLVVDDAHAIYENVNVYINNQLFVGQVDITGNAVVITDVGQFKF